jgi:CP family cyanate transporter-like MFS transporter
VRRLRSTALPGGGTFLLAAGILLIAANLRPAVTSVPPLLPLIRADLDLSAAAAGLLTTLPLLCFGGLAPFAPSLGRRFGLERALAISLTLLALGLLVRLAPTAAALFAGTLAAGGAIAFANVLLPALVKRDYGSRAGVATGAYTTSLIIVAALASGFSVPLEHALGGWRQSLGFWALPAVFALAVWAPRTRLRSEPELVEVGGMRRLLRSPVAWQVAGFMALQTFSFYGLATWLPALYQDHGLSAATAGLLLSIMTVAGMPLALVLPGLAMRSRNQSMYVCGVTVLTAIGITGLLVAPTAAPYLWVVIIGLGQAPALPMALILMVLRSREDRETARLSAMSQSVGYGVAAVGPVLLGAIHDATGSWTPPVALLLVLTIPQFVVGLRASRPVFV